MMLFKVTGPYFSALSLVPRAFGVEARRNCSKSLVNLREMDKRSLDHEDSKQKQPIQITEPVVNSTSMQPLSTVPLKSERDLENKEEQRKEAVEASPEAQKHIDILLKKNVLHKEDIANDYFSDNPDGKPTDTKSSGATGLKITETKSSVNTEVDEEQKNDPHKILEVTTKDIDQEEDFFNDYLDGKKDDPKNKYNQMVRDEFSPYVQRLLLKESESLCTMASEMKNMSSYDKTEKNPSTGINKTLDDLAKLCMDSSNKVSQKSTGPVCIKNYSTDINSCLVQPIIPNLSKITSDKLAAETNSTVYNELAKKFLKSTSKNHIKKVGPVIVNIKNTFESQPNPPAKTNDPNYRKISNRTNLPTGVLGYDKSRISKSKTMDEIDLNKRFDDIAKRCLKSPVNKIDQIIIEEMAKPKYTSCMKKKGTK